MKTRLFFVLTIFCLGIFPGDASALRSPTKSIQVLMGDSGTMANKEEAEKVKMLLLQRIKELSKTRGFRNALLEFISLSSGRTIWVGTPSIMTGEDAEKLVNAIKMKPGRCNKLTRGFDALKSNLENLDHQKRMREVWIIVFSSLIDTPEPCEKTKITLPQVAPVYDFTESLTASGKVKSVSFYWVKEEQFKVWSSALKPMVDWQNEQPERKFVMHKEPNTKYQLSIGLDGGRK
jgi:predicted peroxiredoxin